MYSPRHAEAIGRQALLIPIIIIIKNDFATSACSSLSSPLIVKAALKCRTGSAAVAPKFADKMKCETRVSPIKNAGGWVMPYATTMIFEAGLIFWTYLESLFSDAIAHRSLPGSHSLQGVAVAEGVIGCAKVAACRNLVERWWVSFTVQSALVFLKLFSFFLFRFDLFFVHASIWHYEYFSGRPTFCKSRYYSCYFVQIPIAVYLLQTPQLRAGGRQ